MLPAYTDCRTDFNRSVQQTVYAGSICHLLLYFYYYAKASSVLAPASVLPLHGSGESPEEHNIKQILTFIAIEKT